jgi:predicted transcriptional regulator
VRVTFLSPEAALIGLAVAVPILALAWAESRARIARAVLRLPAPLTRGWAYVIAIALFAIFVAVGAAQPVLERERVRPVRSDAEVFFVFDTTRSMAAASSADSATRFERARNIATDMRTSLRELRVGVASMTDRLLAHLFPSPSVQSFQLTLEKTLGVERPASVQRGNGLGTSLGAFIGIPDQQYFDNRARFQVLVVFTDAESRPFNPALLRASFRKSRIKTVLVRIGSGDERVYENGVQDVRYRPQASAAQLAATFAEATRGELFEEEEVSAAVRAVRSAAGRGGSRSEMRAVEPTPLASYAFAAAFLPLAFLLWRRNLR